VRERGLLGDEVDRLRHALAIATLPEVVSAPLIRQLIDVHESGPTVSEFGVPGVLAALWEWADISLEEFLTEPDQNPNRVADMVEENVAAALRVLHGAGIVHLDVTPNNILRVDGTWKLADLDSCVEPSSPAVRRPLTSCTSIRTGAARCPQRGMSLTPTDSSRS
jgi:serine/threonine protein kinase